MKQLISRRSFLKAAGVTTAVAAVSLGAPAASACYPGSFKDITILYTNDVHTYIDKKSPELTYAAIAALKKSYQDAGKNVLLVDAGDHIQGTAYGSMDEGASIIQLMNAAGYDVATPGNHEFDYGMARAKEVMAEADFPYLSSNWVNLPLGNRVLPDVKYFTIGGRVIAFVGITTPETFTKSTPAYFMDKSQSRYIYDILGGDDGQKLYKAVQKSIDKAKVLADYVIGLGHLGVDPSSSPWTSKEVIEHTSGFDAFIDGHSHTKMECEWVKDLSGKAVALTQTGSYFANVGEMTIKADGSIATRLISSYEGSDSAVADIQNAWVASVDDMLGEKIAVADTNFYISDPETRSIYEVFTGEETHYGKLVLRSQPDKRAGMYFFVMFGYEPDDIALACTFELSVDSTGDAKTRTYKFTVPETHSVTREIALGVTGSDWPWPKARVNAWKLVLKSPSGKVLAQKQSWLWEYSGDANSGGKK